MTDYDKMLDEAEDDAEKDIAEKLAGTEVDLKKLEEAFKDSGDEKHIIILAKKINAAADSAAKKQAWQEFGFSAGMKALKLAKKVLLAGMALFLVLPARAALLDLDPVFDWAKSNSKRTRAGISVDLNAKTKGVGYIPLAWDAKRDYWDLGLGFSATSAKSTTIAPGFGFNLVALGHDALKNILGSRVGLLPLPPLWIGPVVEGPDLRNISDRWDYKERVSFYLSYGFLGG